MDNLKLCGLTSGEIADLIGKSGFNINHALRISNSIYKKHISGIHNIPGIPRKLKEELGSISATGLFGPIASEVSVDKTVKYLFETEDGRKFETVYIPDNKRHTVCVSSQSGCRMGCPFCVTGRYGFHGNLTAGEIVNQVISIPEAGTIDHVVFMGMGEPMDNIGQVLKASMIMTAEWGLSLSPRSITVSSVGITPGIERFLSETDCNLTVSLFSPFYDERKKVVPVEKKYPIDQIIRIMKNAPLKKKRRLSLSYVMIKDMNDTDRHLEGLISLLKDSDIRINFLPYHPVEGDGHFSSSAERLQFFRHNLVISGISASVRRSRGSDIAAACGLLASGMTTVSGQDDSD